MNPRYIPLLYVGLVAAIFAAMVFAMWGVPWIEEALGGKGASYATAAPWGQ